MRGLASPARQGLGEVALDPVGLGREPRRKTGVHIRPRIRLEVQQRRVCRASQETDRPAPGAPKKKNAPKLPATPALPWAPLPTPASTPQEHAGMNPSRFILGGAAAVAVVAAGVYFGSSMVESLETVPALASLEVLVGAAVSARALTVYLADRKARSAVEQKVNSAVSEFKDVLGLDPAGTSKDPPLSAMKPGGKEGGRQQEPSSEDDVAEISRGLEGALSQALESQAVSGAGPGAVEELSMLEVELRSIVDAAASAAMGEDGPLPSAVTVDRRRLIHAVAQYIRSREFQSKTGQEKLLAELEASEAIRMSLAELQKSKESRRAKKAAEAALWERLQRQAETALAQEPETALEQGRADASGGAGRNHLLASDGSGSADAWSHDAGTSSKDERFSEGAVDELEAAMEKARRFRAKLDAMRKSRERRQEGDEEMDGDGEGDGKGR